VFELPVEQFVRQFSSMAFEVAAEEAKTVTPGEAAN